MFGTVIPELVWGNICRQEVYHMRSWGLKDHYLYEATLFPLNIVKNSEQRNTQKKDLINRRLAFYRDSLCRAAVSLYMLK